MAWWDALFLNEGFASLVEYIGTDHATPQFEASRGFYGSSVVPAMVATSWAASRSLESPVGSSAQIESQFDGVAYSFGASLLQSTRGFMEARVPGSFFGGVGAYLRAHENGNAGSSALWDALGAAGGLPELPGWLADYTAQVGFPVVTLAWLDPAGSEASGVGVLAVSQRRHFAAPASRAAAPPAQAAYTWWVPLTLASGAPPGVPGGDPVATAAAAALGSGGFTAATWGVTVGSAQAPFNVSAHGWVKANVNASGFYRVNYPVSLWRALAAGVAAQLAAGAPPGGCAPLTPLDRSQLLDDVFALAEGGTDGPAQPVDMPLALDVAAVALARETTPEAWTPALGHLANLRGLLFADNGTPGAYAGCVDSADAFARGLLAPLVGGLGWNGSASEPPIIVGLRTAALSAGSAAGLPAVTARAAELWAGWAAGGGTGGSSSFAPDLLPLVLANAVRWGLAAPDGTPAFQLLLARTAATDDAGLKRVLLGALAASRDRSQLGALLAVALNASVVRTGDSVSVIASVAGSAYGRDLAWAFTQANWPTLMDRYGAGGFALASLVSSTARGFTTDASYAAVTAWYASHPTPGAALEAAAAAESVAMRAGWRAAQLDATCAKLATLAGR